ncbi:hypothetical protein JQ615_38910 [Bradyrhizobium jicamae]|uniref:Zinc finger Ogr/Delta-type domain-containing protein n=1 Tax=Bradyrhizobium jicamae TaxID=280332 RepID=A0ABS5FWY0_9BRAD|nr:hypothetical protein [Bradyrhizobium jicamae]MBR0801335.1 hypothetical protein [Bradyrhizobium jicamae]MBR0937057.1 hypothetical protein [Bradyrhizobium jicamae]
MFQTEDAIARCECGHEITNFRPYADTRTGTRFLTARCEKCGEIAVLLADQKQQAISR